MPVFGIRMNVEVPSACTALVVTPPSSEYVYVIPVTPMVPPFRNLMMTLL